MGALSTGAVQAAALGFLCVRELLTLAAVGLALSGIDDLFIDSVYFARRLARWIAIRPAHPHIAVEALRSADPGWMAVLIPAWDEAEVIGATLHGLMRTYDYPRYRVFVGVYPNDPATLAVVRAVGDARIEAVVTTRPGPTTKADCLNHLWRAALAHERRTGVQFKAMVLHDAEDVAHAAELRVFDHLIPRIALVQLPVIPFADPASRWVGGHYLDEFAECHGKDVIVREALGAAVPSAGVATAIERTFMARIADASSGLPFDPECLTEDYELGLKVKAHGGRGALIRLRDASGIMVASRGYFPGNLRSAVRQKSRWMLGIALAGWDRIGWRGGAADNYMLWRDRKPLFTTPLLLCAYLATVGGLATLLLRHWWPPARALQPVATSGGPLALLIEFNAALLIWRVTLRVGFTADLHGWREGLRAIPRILVANFINTVATARALRNYLAIAIDGRAAQWDKTCHHLREPAL